MPARAGNTILVPGLGVRKIHRTRAPKPPGREVAGPYRSQSSVPSIRAQATPREHHRVAPSVASLTSLLHPIPGPIPATSPEYALQQAAIHGIEPPASARGLWGAARYDRIANVARQQRASHEGIVPDPIAELVIGAIPTAGLGAAADLTGMTARAALAGRDAEGAASAIRASEQAAKAAGADSKLAELLRGGVVRRAATAAASKAEPEAVRIARLKALARLSREAEKVPAPIRTAAKVGGQAVSLPVRRPFVSPVAAQVPLAVMHGNPAELVKGLEGKGLYAALSSDAAAKIGAALPGEASQLAKEAFNLPATVLPSTYLTAAAGVKAAGGNSSDLKALLHQWEQTGLLPALVKGDGSAALKALEERPLYSALEASGAASVAGRGAGALARAATGDHVGGLARPDLTVAGYPNVAMKRGYSRDLFRQAFQRLQDRRTGSQIDISKRRGRKKLEKVLHEAADRFQSNQEAIRRLHRRAALQSAADLLPKRRVGLFNRLDKASANVVSHAIERIVKHPQTFVEDLQHYRDQLVEASRTGNLDKAQAEANATMVSQIDKALKSANPEHVVAAANSFIAAHAPIVQELVDRGVLSQEQAAKAAAIPFARVHMGAGYQDGVGVVDRHGQPLGLGQITAEMQRHGIEPPGFISHRPVSNADFYQPGFPERGALPRAARTGEAAATGSHAAGYDAVVRQLVRSHGLLDRVKWWDSFISRFGVDLKGAGVQSMKDVPRVLRDPARYGLDPNVDWVGVRRYPWLSLKREIEGAMEHQDPTIADEGFLHSALESAVKGEGSGPIVFMPRAVLKRMGEHYKPTPVALQRAQAATTAFKRAVLPFSPSFYFGNAIDNMIRTGLAGINPAHFVIGAKVAKELTPEEKAELVGGAHFASVDKLAAHRSADALFRGHSAWEAGARAVAHFFEKPGPKALPAAVSATSHALLSVNALLTETLPQYGALGKLALGEARATQRSWAKALLLQDRVAKDFAKGVREPDSLTRYQKSIEEVYGNWSRMGPSARKFLSSVAPFWTWMRAAFKFVYVTMPAHHPIQTGILTAMARGTQKQREELGLDKLIAEPDPSWLQGGLPVNGGIAPWGKYQSFGFASAPVEGFARSFLPQLSGVMEGLHGRDWKGSEVGGDEVSHLALGFGALIESFIPGFNLGKGLAQKGVSSLNPLRTYDKSTVQYLRQPKQQIEVPVKGSSSGTTSSSYADEYGKAMEGSTSSSYADEYAKAMGGG